MKYKVSDRQFEFLKTLRSELHPLDENADKLLCNVLENREYNEFQRRVIRDLRARWIRDKGLHNKSMKDGSMKYEDELNNYRK